jgi:hypothetical protein
VAGLDHLVTRWTAEEGRLAVVLRDYLLVTHNIDPVALELGRMATMQKRWMSDKTALSLVAYASGNGGLLGSGETQVTASSVRSQGRAFVQVEAGDAISALRSQQTTVKLSGGDCSGIRRVTLRGNQGSLRSPPSAARTEGPLESADAPLKQSREAR